MLITEGERLVQLILEKIVTLMSWKLRIWMQLREVLAGLDLLVFELPVICNVFS
jgi:hypothetical protein